MTIRKNSRSALLLAGGSLFALAGPAFAQSAVTAAESHAVSGDAIPEVIVTAQKRSENQQNVPIAVSSFSEESLKQRGISGAADLRTQIPNLAFSRNATNSVNFQIRGIGSKLTTYTADSGVGVHVNNAPLTTSRIADTDFYDVERVEVLRGPQGTLYGRNSTGGVVNIITAKPKDDASASLTGDAGNYGMIKLRGYVNAPITEGVSARIAGYYLTRNGYDLNTYTGNRADDRNLWAMRGTIGFHPTDKFSAFLMWEHFQERDRRLKSSKGLCTTDAGPASVGGVPTNAVTRGLLSAGCTNGSLYSASAFGAPNSLGTIAGIVGLATGSQFSNANAGVVQDPDLRHFASQTDPTYKAHNDIVEFNMEYALSDSLKLSSLTSYSKDYSDAKQDSDSFVPTSGFANTALTPGGVFVDPQLGAQKANAYFTENVATNKQWTQELRLQSSFDGPINFNVGGIYIDYKVVGDFILASNALTLRTEQLNLAGAGIYVDPSPQPDGSGHNYLLNRTPYHLKAAAAFGELYWQVAPTLRLTGGLRYTDDKKASDVVPVQLFTPGQGLVVTDTQRVEFREVTGRFNAEWTPTLPFTNHTMFYASYSRGYKGGGFNPNSSVSIGGVQPTYKPEFVNAFEIGTKNTLAGGHVFFNLTGFYYDYVNYQVSKVVALTVANENINATVKGLEAETIVQPVRGLRFNGALGLLDTSIKHGSTSLDLLNRTQGDPALTLVKNGNGTNCAVNTPGLAGVLGGINAGFIPAAALLGVCSGAFASQGVIVSDGHAVDLTGKQLPDSPRWTLTLGGEYRYALDADWSMTFRGDYYRQGKSFARVYNATVDRLKSWDNINLSLTAADEPGKFSVQFFVRNLANKTAITSTTTNTELFGLTTQVYLTEPRTFGISVTKSF